MLLILARMIDSPGAEPVVLALWLAVNTLQVILSHQERKGRRKKAMKVTGVVAMGMTGRKRESRHYAKMLHINKCIKKDL